MKREKTERLIQAVIEKEHPSLKGHIDVQIDLRGEGKHYQAKGNDTLIRVTIHVPASHPKFNEIISRAGLSAHSIRHGATVSEQIRGRVS